MDGYIMKQIMSNAKKKSEDERAEKLKQLEAIWAEATFYQRKWATEYY